MVNELLSTPDTSNHKGNDPAHVNELTEYLNSLTVSERYVSGQSIVSKHGEIKDDYKTATAKYYSIFGSQLGFFENNFQWSVKPQGEGLSTNNGRYQIDKSGCLSSEGSSFSLCHSRSHSISPRNEMVESPENTSPENVWHHPNRESIPWTVGSNRRVEHKLVRKISTNRSQNFCANVGEGKKLTQTRIKRNRSHRRWNKRNNAKNICTNTRFSSGRREWYGDSEAKKSVYSPSDSTQSDEMSPAVHGGEEVSPLQSISRRKGIRYRYPYEMYMNSTRLTYAEAQEMLELVIKDNMVFAFSTDQGGSRFLQEHLKSASPRQL